MKELIVRWFGSGLLLLGVGVLGLPEFTSLILPAAGYCLFAFGVFRLPNERRANPGVAGFVAFGDALTISWILATLGGSGTLGFLCAAPCAFAVSRYGTQPLSLAPLAASSLFVSAYLLGGPFDAALLGQAVGVLVLCFMLESKRIVATTHRALDPEELRPLEGEEPTAYLELRESLRRMREMYRDLQYRARRDGFATQVAELRHGPEANFLRRVVNKLADLSQAESLSLYTLGPAGSSLVFRAGKGATPNARADTLPLNPDHAPAQVTHFAAKALDALASDERKGTFRNVVLRHRGKLVGLLCASDPDPVGLEQTADALEQIAPYVAQAIAEEAEHRAWRFSAERAEFLYDLGSLLRDIDSLESGVALVTAELAQTLSGADVRIKALRLPPLPEGEPSRQEGHWWIGDEASAFARDWLGEDPGIRSLAVVPVEGASPLAIVAFSRVADGLDESQVEVMRWGALELSRAIRALDSRRRVRGWLPDDEFRQTVRQAGQGCLIVFSPLPTASPSDARPLRQERRSWRLFRRRLTLALPADAVTSARSNGVIAVWSESWDSPKASSWARAVIEGSPAASSGAHEWGFKIAPSQALAALSADSGAKAALAHS